MAKFMIGDRVVVRADEGLDTPREARGKTGMVVEYVGDLQYTVKMINGREWCACEYHLVKVPQEVLSYEEMAVEILNLDPDLREKVIDIRNWIPELAGFSLTTTLLVLATTGYDELYANPRLLKGSGINEVI
jgi:hypothetical protein